MNSSIPSRETPVFAPQPTFGDFFRGLKLPISAVAMIFGEKKLRLLSFICALVTSGALVLVVWGATFADELVGKVLPKPEAMWGQWGWYFLVALTFVVLLVVGANVLPLLLLAPLQDPLSEAAEESLGGFRSPRFELGAFIRSTLLSLSHTFARVILLVSGHVLLFALHLIPGVGSVMWTVLSVLWTSLWMGAEYLAAPMARHGQTFSEVRRVVRRRLALSLGFGSATYVLMWIPLLNCFFIPVAIVSGTLLYRGLLAAGGVPPSKLTHPA